MDANTGDYGHTSVLLHELVEHISGDFDKNIIVDCTLGLAGHAVEIISKMNDGDTFIGFDADDRNLSLARQRLEAHIQKLGKKITLHLIHSNFEHIKKELERVGIIQITGIYYDLGVSSLHFDEAERGFSLRLEGPLDMRFDNRSGRTAGDIINFEEKHTLFEILRNYGEEPHARKIAERLITARKKKKFQTTGDLCNFLDSEINSHIKTKTRVFQAFRIAVNNELGVLEKSLHDAIQMLGKNGRIGVISFHSLEDRIVKHLFRKETRECICSDIICTCQHTKTLRLCYKGALTPSQQEISHNSRARSAKLRFAEKI